MIFTQKGIDLEMTDMKSDQDSISAVATSMYRKTGQG
jgi:hypothetical protein